MLKVVCPSCGQEGWLGTDGELRWVEHYEQVVVDACIFPCSTASVENGRTVHSRICWLGELDA